MSHLHIAILSNLSGWELILIFTVILLFFGAKRLPELSESLGKSLRQFKKATSEVEEEVRSALDSENNKADQPNNKETEKSNACPIKEENDSSSA